MTRFGKQLVGWLLLSTTAVVLAGPGPAGAAGAATATFGGEGAFTHPGTVKVDKRAITVDLSAVGKAEVLRAVFIPKKETFNGQDRRCLEPVKVTSGGKEVPLMGPRYVSFDATQAVREALKASATVTLLAESLPGWDGRTARLEVTFEGKMSAKLPVVTGLTARHHHGQTILTFREVDSPLTSEDATVPQLRAARKKLPDADPGIAYRIYRSTRPDKWDLVDEIAPLSCWNEEYYGGSFRDDTKALRYVVEDGAAPVPPGTGIYAHSPAEAGKAWYAVTVAVNGAEDLSTLAEGNKVGPIDETVGPGDPILQRTTQPKSFVYRDNPTLDYYVRWECEPRCNVPSRPIDYVVAVPDKVQWPAPVNLAFHCWGGSLNGGYGWWYWGPQPAMMVATNQIPYDWWTGYHEAKGTWKPWSAGTVRSYTFRRLDGFFEWVCTRYKVDRSRVFTGGSSMGGSGCLVYASHLPGKIAWTSSWVGVHVPAQSPGFKGSYEQCYGREEWKLKHESGPTAFEHFDDAHWVRTHPEVSLGFMAFGNGKDDGGIGWPQALAYFRALQEARQPHLFHWALGGHGVRSTLPGPGASGNTCLMDIRTDRSLPAFTKCSLDGDPGTGKRLAEPKDVEEKEGSGVRTRKDPYDGDSTGYANRWLYWLTKDIVDEPGRWEMTVALLDSAPADECTVSLTPRRLQKLAVKPGQTFTWTATAVAGSSPAQSGTVTADKWSLLTVDNLKVRKGGTRVRIMPK